MKHLTATICLTIAVLLGSVGMSWSDDLQKKHIIAVLPDGRTAILYDDKTWEISESADNGKIVISVVSMVSGTDEDGYDICTITAVATNRTKYEISDFTFIVTFDDADGYLDFLFYEVSPPGETKETVYTDPDGDCSRLDRANVLPILVHAGKRSIKEMKWKTDEEAKKFIVNNLLAVSSQHDHEIIKLKIGSID